MILNDLFGVFIIYREEYGVDDFKHIYTTPELAKEFFDEFQKQNPTYKMMKINPTIITNQTTDNYREAVRSLPQLIEEQKRIGERILELSTFIRGIS